VRVTTALKRLLCLPGASVVDACRGRDGTRGLACCARPSLGAPSAVQGPPAPLMAPTESASGVGVMRACVMRWCGQLVYRAAVRAVDV
jgi:hypothetical protein